ncbi:MAG: dTMP kinase [Porticoccaceae bacterium]
MSNPGKFITIEGGEGAGKSTNIGFIQEFLVGKGIELISTREPGGTVYAEKIRNLLLDHQDEKLGAMAELLLIFAARAQHLEQLILPALKQGKWVLCDRFTDATYAYQGAGRALGMLPVAELENLVQGSLRPDLTLILDIPVELGMGRVAERGGFDRFECEHREFFESVRQAYLDLAQAAPERYAVIDTRNSLEQVQSDITLVLSKLFS